MPTTKPAKPAAQPDFPIRPVIGVASIILAYVSAPYIIGTLISLVLAAFGWSTTDITAWSDKNPTAQFIYIVLFDAVVLGVVIAIMRGAKAKWRDIGWVRPKLKNFGATLLAYPPYFIANAVALLIATPLFHLNSNQSQQTGFESATDVSQLVVTFVSLVILPPLVEEIAMRGFLFSSLKSKFSFLPAMFLTSGLFAAAHLQFGQDAPLLWAAAIDTFILSLFLCYLRQKTGNLWAGIGLHMLKNLIAFSVLFIEPFLK